jgi:hypothetical protein
VNVYFTIDSKRIRVQNKSISNSRLTKCGGTMISPQRFFFKGTSTIKDGFTIQNGDFTIDLFQNGEYFTKLIFLGIDSIPLSTNHD